MAVIINEFEVVVEPPAPAPADPENETESLNQPGESLQLAPHDMAIMLTYKLQRAQRISAH